jgi:hypothetical protein
MLNKEGSIDSTMTRGLLTQSFFLAFVVPITITVLTGASQLFGGAQAFSIQVPVLVSSPSRVKALQGLLATKSTDNIDSQQQHKSSNSRGSSMTKEEQYSEQELKEAMGSLLADSDDPIYDARHIFGYQDDYINLSMLQRITATRILDYRKIMVSAFIKGRKEEDIVLMN